MLNTLEILFRNNGGNVALYFAIAIIPIMVLLGGTVDLSRTNNIKQELQAALDSAVLAGASQGKKAYKDEAKRYFARNSDRLKFASPSAKFSIDTSSSKVLYNGRATAKVPMTFSEFIGLKFMELEVYSQVTADKEEAKLACIYLLDKWKNYSLRVNSGADIVAKDCEMHVHSGSKWAANFNSGMNLEFNRICIAGSGTLDNHRNVQNVELECAVDADPYKGKIKEPSSLSCDFSNLNYNGGNVTLKPGVYCGWVNFNSGTNVTFEPGLYSIKNGGWNVNGGDWEGEGVTFYFADQSKIQFNSAVKADLKPPKSGDYKDILMFEKEGLSESDFILDDSRDFNIEGVLHLPSRNTTYNSGSTVYSRKLTMIFNSLTLNQTEWNLEGVGGKSGSVANIRISH